MAKFIKPSAKVQFYSLEGLSIEQSIEDAARTCYKSKNKITDKSAEKLTDSLLRRGHHAMLEFGYARVALICNRGTTHELVRHRLCSFAQESTRYVDYAVDDGGIEFIIPAELSNVENHTGLFVGMSDLDLWKRAMTEAEFTYMELRRRGVQAQIARGVLPIDLKTEIVVSANLREWMHIFDLRCAKTAHPHIRNIMLNVLDVFSNRIPVLFHNLKEKFVDVDREQIEVFEGVS